MWFLFAWPACQACLCQIHTMKLYLPVFLITLEMCNGPRNVVSFGLDYSQDPFHWPKNQVLSWEPNNSSAHSCDSDFHGIVVDFPGWLPLEMLWADCVGLNQLTVVHQLQRSNGRRAVCPSAGGQLEGLCSKQHAGLDGTLA